MSLAAKKSLGQNFLKSKSAINAMISAPGINQDDTVIEIGPGKGALTRPLLETGATVIAFELDQRMVEYLEQELSEYVQSGKLVLHHQDVIEADIVAATNNRPYKIVANIPYYITNLIIRHFLSHIHQPTDMCLLIQKEVAERIVSRDSKESILSLSVKLFGTPKYITKVARQYFSPSPRVDSAIINVSQIGRHNISDPDFESLFFTIVKTAFGQKRKQAIKNLLKIDLREKWESIFSECGIPANARAEDISFGDWLQITRRYQSM